jgi:hypothetical protein
VLDYHSAGDLVLESTIRPGAVTRPSETAPFRTSGPSLTVGLLPAKQKSGL